MTEKELNEALLMLQETIKQAQADIIEKKKKFTAKRKVDLRKLRIEKIKKDNQ